MNNLFGLFIFSAISLICRGIEYYFRLPVPMDIIGLLLLFLYFNYIKGIPTNIENTANNLFLNIGLLFVPIGVGLLNYLDFMIKYWKVILFASILTTISCLILCLIVFCIFTKYDNSGVNKNE